MTGRNLSRTYLAVSYGDLNPNFIINFPSIEWNSASLSPTHKSPFHPGNCLSPFPISVLDSLMDMPLVFLCKPHVNKIYALFCTLSLKYGKFQGLSGTAGFWQKVQVHCQEEAETSRVSSRRLASPHAEVWPKLYTTLYKISQKQTTHLNVKHKTGLGVEVQTLGVCREIWAWQQKVSP